jgi:hypothetical protein
MSTPWIETGDVLLFGNPRSWLSRFIQWGDGTDVSHVAVAVRNPPWLDRLDGLYVMEAGTEPFPDVEYHEYKYGVRMSTLEQVVQSYKDAGGTVRLRKLKTDRTWTEEQLRQVHLDVHNRPYDDTPSSWVEAFYSYEGGHGHRDRFFCSALVSYVFCGLGLLSPTANWSLISPTDYLRDEHLPLNSGVTLGECIEL